MSRDLIEIDKNVSEVPDISMKERFSDSVNSFRQTSVSKTSGYGSEDGSQLSSNLSTHSHSTAADTTKSLQLKENEDLQRILFIIGENNLTKDELKNLVGLSLGYTPDNDKVAESIRFGALPNISTDWYSDKKKLQDIDIIVGNIGAMDSNITLFKRITEAVNAFKTQYEESDALNTTASSNQSNIELVLEVDNSTSPMKRKGRESSTIARSQQSDSPGMCFVTVNLSSDTKNGKRILSLENMSFSEERPALQSLDPNDSQTIATEDGPMSYVVSLDGDCQDLFGLHSGHLSQFKMEFSEIDPEMICKIIFKIIHSKIMTKAMQGILEWVRALNDEVLLQSMIDVLEYAQRNNFNQLSLADNNLLISLPGDNEVGDTISYNSETFNQLFPPSTEIDTIAG